MNDDDLYQLVSEDVDAWKVLATITLILVLPIVIAVLVF